MNRAKRAQLVYIVQMPHRVLAAMLGITAQAGSLLVVRRLTFVQLARSAKLAHPKPRSVLQVNTKTRLALVLARHVQRVTTATAVFQAWQTRRAQLATTVHLEQKVSLSFLALLAPTAPWMASQMSQNAHRAMQECSAMLK